MKHLIHLAVCLLTTLLGAAPGDLRWSFATGGVIYSSPAVDAAGNLYFGSEDGDIYSLNASGGLRWIFGAAADWVDSSPALSADGALYVGSWDGEVYALSQATGALLWSFDTGGVLIASPAIGPDGTVYVGGYDGNLYALSPDGDLRWSYPAEAEIESSVALDHRGNLYFGDALGYLYSLTPEGGERWVCDLSLYAEPTATDGGIQSSPAVGADGTVYVGTRGALLAAVAGESGLVHWTYPSTDFVDSSPVIDTDGSVYFASRDGYLTKLSPEGAFIWELLVGDVFYASPAIDAQGLLYLPAYVNDGISSLLCLDGDGEVQWEYPFVGYNDSSPNLGPDGTVYFGSYDFSLYAVRGSAPLSVSTPWPRFRGDAPQTGRWPIGYLWSDPVVTAFLHGAVAVGDDWYVATWPSVGHVFGRWFPWIYHTDHEWLYCWGTGGEAAWFYDPRLGWIYSQRSAGGYLWVAALQRWVYHAAGTSEAVDGRWFYDFGCSLWCMGATLEAEIASP